VRTASKFIGFPPTFSIPPHLRGRWRCWRRKYLIQREVKYKENYIMRSFTVCSFHLTVKVMKSRRMEWVT
jgi:hypothetical protein